MLNVNQGQVGEILVRSVPEFAATIERVVAAELESAADADRNDTIDLTPFTLVREFRDEVLVPALRGLPATADLVTRCGRALAEVWALPEPPGDYYREAIALRILDRLDEPELTRLLDEAPTLMGRIYLGRSSPG